MRTAHLCLIAAGLGQLAAVWIPSLASEISGLGDRLLSPTIALAALASLHGLQTAVDSLAPRRWAAVLLLLPFAFLALGRDIVPRELLSYPGRINYPIERSLWRELHELDALRSSTHFYSDRDFVHQVFAGIPQRIVWDTGILRDPAAVDRFREREGPFILLGRRVGGWGVSERWPPAGSLEKIAFQRYGLSSTILRSEMSRGGRSDRPTWRNHCGVHQGDSRSRGPPACPSVIEDQAQPRRCQLSLPGL
jgi:hypothetical protein